MKHLRRAAAALVAAAAAVTLSTVTAQPAQAATVRWDGLRTYNYDGAGNAVSAGAADVIVQVGPRSFQACGTCAVTQMDAAAIIYDTGDPAVGNVQVDLVRLYAGVNPGALRAGPTSWINSNGAPSVGTSTAEICTRGDSNGFYYATVRASWRHNGNLHIRDLGSNYTNAVYRTC